MKINMYSIHDSAAQAFLPPFYQNNNELAIRAFTAAVNGHGDQSIKMNPEQFTLYLIGMFDDATGMILAEAPEALMNGKVLVDPQKNKYTDATIDSVIQAVSQAGSMMDATIKNLEIALAKTNTPDLSELDHGFSVITEKLEFLATQLGEK